MTDSLAAILRRTRALLLDFDGPVCSVFAGRPAPKVAAELRAAVAVRLGVDPATLPETDGPLQFVSRTAQLDDLTIARTASDLLRDLEVAAVASAEPTRDADAVLRAARETGRRVAIVSNNSIAAVRAYLARGEMNDLVDLVVGRYQGMNPRLLKPNPHLVARALGELSVEPAAAVLVGDSASDNLAAAAAGVGAIGYANKPGKLATLASTGAAAVVDTMTELANALRAVPAPA